MYIYTLYIHIYMYICIYLYIYIYTTICIYIRLSIKIEYWAQYWAYEDLFTSVGWAFGDLFMSVGLLYRPLFINVGLSNLFSSWNSRQGWAIGARISIGSVLSSRINLNTQSLWYKYTYLRSDARRIFVVQIFLFTHEHRE